MENNHSEVKKHFTMADIPAKERETILSQARQTRQRVRSTIRKNKLQTPPKAIDAALE